MKAKVLFLLHLPPPVHGSSLIGKYIIESSIIRDAFDTTHLNLLASKSVQETGKVTLRKLINFIKLGLRLLRKLACKNPDLCYMALTVSGVAFYRDVVLVMLLKLFRVKIVYHLHHKGVSRKQNNKVYAFLYRYVFRDTDVILLSNHLYTDIAAFVPKHSVHICPNGIPDMAFAKTKKRESELVQLLFLSNLFEAKGVFVLLEAIAILVSKGVALKCSLIGAEGDISKAVLLDRIHTLGLADHVFYVGKKYGKEKHRFFAQSDIFVFPSFYETFGLVIVEAMQYALPVVSTNEGGIPDLVEHNTTGFLVDKRNPAALAEKIELLLQDNALRQEMGSKGHEKYLKNYRLIHFEQNLSALLTLVLHERAHSHF